MLGKFIHPPPMLEGLSKLSSACAAKRQTREGDEGCFDPLRHDAQWALNRGSKVQAWSVSRLGGVQPASTLLDSAFVQAVTGHISLSSLLDPPAFHSRHWRYLTPRVQP
jgi:hypothetical protein